MAFEERYDSILEEAREEYEYIPPSKYYREGYNLYRRMAKYRSSHLLFLHDIRVPHNNNMAERLLRAYKRKQHQVMSFRSDASIDYLCQSMSMLLSLRQDSESSVYDSVSKIFDRQKAGRSTWWIKCSLPVFVSQARVWTVTSDNRNDTEYRQDNNDFFLITCHTQSSL